MSDEQKNQAIVNQKQDNNDVLLIDEENGPIIIEEECEQLKPILQNFMGAYSKNHDKPIEEWLSAEMGRELPDKKPEEIKKWTDEIITTLKIDMEKKASLEAALAQGRSKESWLAKEAKAATANMSAQQAGEYLQSLDDALVKANNALYDTITTQAGNVSQNPRLDGFIAEQHHAQTFNLNAEAAGSQYRARVVEPSAKGYTKNGVDIVIEDSAGNVVRRYQSKYCKDSAATAAAFEHGDYRGQQKLIPEGQSIDKKHTTALESPDGKIKSEPLSKKQAEDLRDKAQKTGDLDNFKWDKNYSVKEVSGCIAQNAAIASLQGAAITVGFDIAGRLFRGEKIEADAVVETAITSGADIGVKAAAAGALKVGAEKGILSVIPKGTPIATLTTIASVAIDNVKTIGKMISGKLTVKQGIEKMEQTTISTVAGVMASAKGMAVGAAIGSVFGPVGTVVGGVIGGTVSYIAGSKFAEGVVKVVQKVRDVAVTAVKKIGAGIKEGCKRLGSKIKEGWQKIFG